MFAFCSIEKKLGNLGSHDKAAKFQKRNNAHSRNSRINKQSSLGWTNPTTFWSAIFFFTLCDINKFLDKLLQNYQGTHRFELCHKTKRTTAYLDCVRLHGSAKGPAIINKIREKWKRYKILQRTVLSSSFPKSIIMEEKVLTSTSHQSPFLSLFANEKPRIQTGMKVMSVMQKICVEKLSRNIPCFPFIYQK